MCRFISNAATDQIIFRFSRRRIKIVVASLAVAIVGIVVLAAAFKCMNLFTAVVTGASLTVLVTGWMTLANAFENRAIKKASDFTFMFSLAEREKCNSQIDILKRKSFK
jgi:hypothetical protein